MADDSHLDERYFIDEHKYNCPFCNRNHVAYRLTEWNSFDWDDEKACHVFFVKCDSCEKRSIHLSFAQIGHFPYQGRTTMRFKAMDIDAALHHSIPSSFHTLDERIPRKVREPLNEAEESLRANLLTGASACARKVVYELAADQGAEGADYETRIKSLKSKLSHVDPTYFDTLVTVHQMTSSKVHENAYDGWESKHLRVILGTLREVLREVYVVPEERKSRRESVLALKDELLRSGSDPSGGEEADGGSPSTSS